MSDQITLEEALKLVSFYHSDKCGWQVNSVDGDVCSNVFGNVRGHVFGDVECDVGGSVFGNVNGNVDGFVNGNIGGFVKGNIGGDVCGAVHGTINGRNWESIETPKDKLQRLLDGASEEELLKLINHIENN